ncbi:MAG: hypothetical protein HYZ27_12320 [Deltaproteobacteria bacterium]|nr:hypothetical protein [Deltaproteobacteria bacterium]
MRLITVLAAGLLACTALAESKSKVAPEYTLTSGSEPAQVTAGSEARYAITIAPKAPWVFKITTPLKIVLTASDQVKLAKRDLDAKDIVDAGAEPKSVATTFTASAKGEHKIAADLAFFLCTDEVCKRYTDKIETKVRAK